MIKEMKEMMGKCVSMMDNCSPSREPKNEEEKKMTTKSIGFIGGGRITRILLEGWKKKGFVPAQVTVSDANQQVLDALKQKFSQITCVLSDNAQPAASDIVFLALHPPVMKDGLQAVTAALKPNAILVSLVPKFSMAALSNLLGGFQRIVRMIPNAPSIVNRGYNPTVFSPAISAAEKAELSDMFALLGAFPEVLEATLEAYVITTAIGPTYFWPQMNTLRELAVSFGLSEQAAKEGVRQMMEGALATMFDTDLTFEEVMNLVPAKPLADDQAMIKNLYQTKLTELYQKLKG